MHDTLIGTQAHLSAAVGGASAVVMDVVFANVAYSGQQRYENAWIWGGTTLHRQYHVASFNAGSGAFVSQQTFGSTLAAIGSGTDFEVHTMVEPLAKNRALDHAIQRLTIGREVGIPTVEGRYEYTMEGAASPNTIVDVLDVFYYADPTSSVNRAKHTIPSSSWQVANSPTGQYLRLASALAASQQLILDAILKVSLGSTDAATINLPDEQWVLWGAAAHCYNLLDNQPGQTTTYYEKKRKEAAREFTRLSARFAPKLNRRPKFDDPI